MKSIFTKITVFIVILLAGTFVSQAQTTGDYRSVNTGNWTTLSTWQRYDGISWLTPTSGQGYPGQNAGTGAVTIQSGHTVTIGNAGITTAPLGVVTVQSTGQLYLTGTITSQINFTINTPQLIVASGGSVYFFNKVRLTLASQAVLTLGGLGTLQGTCNNNVEIYIGAVRFGACSGAPGNVFTFEQLMNMGGTLNAVPSSNTPLCPTSTISLTGSYAGAIGTPPSYSWSVVAPGGGISTYTTQNVTIPNALAGTYQATLTVSTILSGTTYTNSETHLAVINPFPTLTSVTQYATVCPGSPATMNLSGLVPNTTFSLWYSINGVPQTALTGLTSGPAGTSSFTTPNLALANNGQTLQVTAITITNPSTNCSSTFAVNGTLSVWTTGGGTWTGAVSSDWHNAANWCGGVPTATTDVFISGPSVSVPNQPEISASATCRNITLYTGAILTTNGTNSLDVKGNWTNNGTLVASNGTVSLTGTAAQSVGGTAMTTFNNLTINNTAGVTAGKDITVNGVLNLVSASPNETNGTLEMTIDYGNYSNIATPVPNLTTTTTQAHDILNSWILYMGANATTTGIGDVTGKVKRTAISDNTEYTFGNPNTSITFNQNTTGTLPADVMFVITKGSNRGVHANKTDAVARLYQVIRTGGTAPTTFAIKLAYLAGELNGNNDNNLVLWDHHIPYTTTLTPHEHGKTSQSTGDHWVALSGHGIGYLGTQEVIGGFTKYWMFSNTLLLSDQNIWLGAAGTSWNNASNWSAGNIPNCTQNVIIPSGLLNYPDLPVAPVANAKTLTIQTGATVNGSNGNLNICGGIANNGGIGSWNNYGTFNEGTSTVTFNYARTINEESATIAGSANFFNVTLAAGTYMILQPDVTVSVAGTFTKTGNLDAGTNPNTFIYNGTGDQTVVAPDVPRYYNLTLTGSGNKTLPPSELSLSGNLLSDVQVIATGNTLIMDGDAEQIIGGTATMNLNNLTISNNDGILLNHNENITGTLDMALGHITTGSNTLTVTGTGTIVNASDNSFVNGKLARIYSGTGSKDFPIGKDDKFRNMTLNYTALTGSSTVTAEQFESDLPGTIPANTDLQSRYWVITQSGGSAYTYDLTLDGTPYNPGSGTPVILKGDGSTNSALAATFSNPDFTISDQTTFSNFAVGSLCPPPGITAHPVSVSACLGGTYAFSVTATVPTGVPVYQWYVSTTGTGGTYEPVTDGGVYSNSTTASLTITEPTLDMNGYAYRVLISRDCGFDATSNAAVLSVSDLPSITLGASPAVCSGGTTADLPYSATTGDQYSIIWDATATTAGFLTVNYTALAGSPITLTVPAGAPASTYNGILKVKNTGTTCESGEYPFTVTIYALPQGTLTGSYVCTGGPGQLTFTATAGTGPYTLVLEPGNLTINGVVSGTPFDVVAAGTYTILSATSDEGCVRTSGFTAGSATVSFVTPGTVITWDGSVSNDWHVADNWDLGYIPVDCNSILIPSASVTTFPSIFAPVSCNDLTINAGAVLTLEAGEELTVNGTLTNNAGVTGLIIRSNSSRTGSLIESTPGVQATVERYLVQDAWHLISAPTSNAVAGVFVAQYLRPFDEPSNSFGDYIVPVLTPLPVAEGFICWPVESKTYYYEGPMNTGTVTPSLSYTSDQRGNNLVGNPYPSAIDWDAAGWTKTNIGSTIYIWNQGVLPVGNYGTYNGVVGTNGVSNIIPSGQGFFVQAIGPAPVLSMNNSVRVHNQTQSFLKSSAVSNLVRLNFSSAVGADELVVYFDPSASGSYDAQTDAKKMFGEKVAPQVYSYKPGDGEKLSINVLPDLSKPLVVPVSLQPGSNGMLKMTASGMEQFDPAVSVYLEDLKLNQMQNLKLEPVYEFTADTTDNVNRFALHFSNGPIGIPENGAAEEVTIWSWENTVYVKNEAQDLRGGRYMMYDMTGRVLLSGSLTPTEMNRIAANFTEGYYIVKVITGTGVYTRKIYLN